MAQARSGTGPTRALSTVHTEGTDTQPVGTGAAGHRGDRQPDKQGANRVRHTGTLLTVCTEGSDNQPDRGTLGYCLLYIQRALASSWCGGRLGTEGTDNQTDREHT